MPEHSIDELKRQLQQAESRLNAARDARDDAKKRLHAALVAQTNLVGKLATRRGRSIVISNVEFLGEKERPFKVTGFKLNKDGRPGRVEVSMYIDGDPIEFTDYEPPANGK